MSNISYAPLQMSCPCGLAECELYKQTPVKSKAINSDAFYIQSTVNNKYDMSPLYALLRPVNKYADKEAVAAELVKMHEICKKCHENHPIVNTKRNKVYRPVRIRIDFMGFMMPLGIYTHCVASKLIRSDR